MNKQISYNFNALIKKRKLLKLSIDSISGKLTLSVDQIKSLESNSQKGFSTPHFHQISLKKYAAFLDINLDINSELNGPSICHDSSIIKNTDKPNSFLKIIRLKNKYILPIILLTIIIIYYSVIFLSGNLNAVKENTLITVDPDDLLITEGSANKPSSSDGPILVNSPSKSYLTPLKKKSLVTMKTEVFDIPIDFLCTIKSTATKKFSTRLPEKPATYFHIISLDKQTICTIDSDDNFQQYDLGVGEKLTHRGKAPFKIQLNPSNSELYFEGWKVHLQEGDTFIQLNPTSLNLSPRNY